MSNRTIISAIEEQRLLSYDYAGSARLVEPQTYGVNKAGHDALRAHQIGGGSKSGGEPMGKLFLVSRMSNLRKEKTHFEQALASHNPKDSAMVAIYATLPLPKQRTQRLKR
jgi:hypothetical protein